MSDAANRQEYSDAAFRLARLADGLWLAFCDQTCLQRWRDAAPGWAGADTMASSNGPTWCMHCRSCGKRCWRGTACKLCPGCDRQWWLAGEQGAAFAAELGRHGIEQLPPNAYARGEQLCRTGLAPARAARQLLETDR